MRTHLSILILVLVALSAMGCTSSARSAEELREARNFLSQTIYAPNHPQEIIGCYVAVIGFGGELLDLRPDGTYFYNFWTDLVDTESPIKGEVGEYHLIGDVVILSFTGYALDTMKAPERIANAEQRAEERRRKGGVEVFRLKWVDGATYAMRDRLEMWFALESLKNGGIPPTIVMGDTELSMVGLRQEVNELCEHWRD